MPNSVQKKSVLAILALVVVSSGCVQPDSTNLNDDFNLDYEETSINSSGEEIYQSSLNSVDNISSYEVSGSNEFAVNLPVAMSFFIDMNTTGTFEEQSSEFNTTGDFKITFGDNSNLTEFNTSVITSEGRTELTRSIRGKENTTENAKYSREALGLSLESWKTVEAEEVNVLGLSDLGGEENLLLEVDFNSKDLMEHTNRVLETHGLLQTSPNIDQDLEEPSDFSETKAYVWTERNEPPSKIAYYGSSENGTTQIKSLVRFKEVE